MIREHPHDSLEDRMVRMEQALAAMRGERRRLRYALATSLGFLVVVACVAAAPSAPAPDVLAARSFVLVAADETVRGRWTLAQDGSMRLELLDSQGVLTGGIAITGGADGVQAIAGSGAAPPEAKRKPMIRWGAPPAPEISEAGETPERNEPKAPKEEKENEPSFEWLE